MKDATLSSAFKVTDPQVAAIFSDPLRRRLILLLAAQPRSLAELANTMRLDLKKLHYHITVLRKLGIVVVKQQRARAGRAVKVYGAIAASFFVPAKVSVSRPEVALMTELRKSLAKAQERQEGMLYYLTATGEPRMRPVGTAVARQNGATEYWQVLQLSRLDLLQLTAAVEDCLERIRKNKSEIDQTYLVHFAIAPRASSG